MALVGDSKCSARGFEAYAHAVPREESHLSFAEFGGDAKRRHTALEIESEIGDSPNYLDSMARREGFEPPILRFEEESDPEEEH